jgi:hypothetical protein
LKASAITKEREEPTSPLMLIFREADDFSTALEVTSWAIISLSFPSWGDCSKSCEIGVLVNPKNFAAKINREKVY